LWFTIHDDGTLDETDRVRLTERLGRVRIIERREADEVVSDRMRAYPNALALRESYPHIMKAMDAVIYCECDTFVAMDSDVLFLRNFRSPFRDAKAAIFIEDREPSYSLRSWGYLMSKGLTLPKKVNVGITCIRKADVDFDFLEWFVSQARHHSIPYVVEQTFWAALGARLGCRVFDPAQVRVMRAGENDAALVAGHFTARSRHLLPSYVQRAGQASDDAAPVTLATLDPGECATLDLAWYELRRVPEKIVREVSRRSGGSNDDKSQPVRPMSDGAS